MARLFSLLHHLKTRWVFVIPILIADLAGMIFGWYYYWDVGQFNPASGFYEHWAWWPLVADSPNAVLLFFLALLLHKAFGWRNKWLDASALILNIYVGLWTSYLFIMFPDRMGTWDWGSTNNILFFSHLGMPLQALLLVKDLRSDAWPRWAAPVVLASVALYIFVDYWGPMLHPAPFLHPNDGPLHAGSPWLMVVAVLAWLAIAYAKPARQSRPSRQTTP